MTVYRDILGYDTIVADETGIFADFKALPAGTRGLPPATAYPFATEERELQPTLRLPPPSNWYRHWIEPLRNCTKDASGGDPGFIQVCFDIRNMEALGEILRGERPPLHCR